MTYEPDNAVLNQLREIRAILAGHTARFDRLEKDFNELRHLVNHALVPGTTVEPRARQPGEHHDQGEPHHKRTDERVSSIEQRVARIEERLDC
jgi:hypothetical protein